MKAEFECPTKIQKMCAGTPTRYGCQNPWVHANNKDGVFLSATNTKSVAIVKTAGFVDEPRFIPEAVFPTTKKMQTISYDDGMWKNTAAKFAPELEAGTKIMAVKDVLPVVNAETLTVSLDVKLLATLAEAIGSHGHITLLINKPTHAIAVIGRTETKTNAAGVIMPMVTADAIERYQSITAEYRSTS